MLTYEQLKAFADLLAKDQSPILNEHSEIQSTAYDEGRHIYSVRFGSNIFGDVIVDVHIQWNLMEQLLTNPDKKITWNSIGPDSVGIYATFESMPSVKYATVLFKDDLKVLWDRINYESYPFPEEASAEDIWVTLYNRGVWEM